MKIRRRTVELIGLNNDRICCKAVLTNGNWICEIDEEQIVVRTMRQAELELRSTGLATKIIHCPVLPDDT